jgi:outer membrane protein assembly factor BamB
VLGPSLADAVQGHGPLPGPSLQVLGAGLAEALSGIHMAQSPVSATLTALELGTGKTAWTFPGIMNDGYPPPFTGSFAVTLTDQNSLVVLDLASGEAAKTIVPHHAGWLFLRLLAVSGPAAYILGSAGAGNYVLFAYDLTTGFPHGPADTFVRGVMLESRP